METISRNLEALTAFHVVSQEGSFTRAAEYLGTSKSALSKEVSRLEMLLGTRLFHRTTRSLSLTEEGMKLRQYSQKIFDLTNEASRKIRDSGQEITGLIKISAPLSVGDFFFPSFLSEIRTVLPKVTFELDLSNENRDFIEDEVHFAIRASSDHQPNIIARYLGRIRDVICINPSLNEKMKGYDDPEKLSKVDCILNTIDRNWNTWTFRSKSEDLRIEVSGSYAANQYTTARRLCLAGLGVARIPLYLVVNDFKTGRLIRLFPNYEISTHSLYLVYPKNEYPSKKHKVVRQAILDWFKKRREYFV